MPSHSSSKEARYRAVTKHNKEHTVQFSVRLNKNTDADIIKFISALDNKRAYILNLIREDIKNS